MVVVAIILVRLLPLILVFWHYSSISAVLIDRGRLAFVHLMTLAGVVTVH